MPFRPRQTPAHRGSTKLIVVAVLALVIVAAVLLTVKNLGSSDQQADPGRRGAQMIRLKCEKCGYEFSLSLRDLAGQGKDRNRPAELANGAPKADCPACKQQSCAVVMQMRRPGAERVVSPDQAAPTQPPAPR